MRCLIGGFGGGDDQLVENGRQGRWLECSRVFIQGRGGNSLWVVAGVTS